MQSERILVIYTGGTIGMQTSAKGFTPGSGLRQQLAQVLSDRQRSSLPKFEVLEFEHLIDSSNLSPGHWTQIGHTLTSLWQQYAGFVVLHGTDTMAYTAAMLSFMLRGQDKPVIVTGSQIPLTQARTDGIANLSDALLFAAMPELTETAILFGGKLLRGNRSLKLHSHALAAFDSPCCSPLGESRIQLALHPCPRLHHQAADFQVPDFDPAAVLQLHLYPGIQAHSVRLMLQAAELKGVIMTSYGVGNPPDADHELMDVLGDASERGLVIVNLSQCLHGRVEQGAYAAGSALNRIGVVPGGDMTLPAAFTKLHFLIAQGLGSYEVKQQMQINLAGELTA